MSRRFLSWLAVASLSISTGVRADPTATSGASLLRPTDRIVFIGDSITGQGMNTSAGWAHLIQEALLATGGSQTVTSLGGSGQTVEGWSHVEKQSRTGPAFLDVKNVDVQATLDGGADVVVFMLGMNDVLAPALKGDDASIDAWEATYFQLIESVRERTHARLVAVATPTLCTEDPASPKNRMLDRLAERIEAMSAKGNFIVLPTRASMKAILQQGRDGRPDFRVTVDYVHPNLAGHVAIATGMLRGLGEEKAAQTVAVRYGPKFWPAPGETLSYWIHPDTGTTEGEAMRYDIDYTYIPAPGGDPNAPVTLELPAGAGWTSRATVGTPGKGVFHIEGTSNHLTNTLTLHGGGKTTTIPLQAPWLVGSGAVGIVGWVGVENRFDPTKLLLPTDDRLSKGLGFGEALEAAPGHTLAWHRFTSTIDYGGGNAPGNVDLAQVDYLPRFSVGYGLRRIYSPDDRTVHVDTAPLGWIRNDHLTLWVNGESVIGGPGNDSKITSVDVALRKGWNTLVFKSHHAQFVWEFRVDLKGLDGEVPMDLLVSTVSQGM